ncbi:hypothetical protein AC249_AIPGENE16103, partial [Exaiptasia diaphana]
PRRDAEVTLCNEVSIETAEVYDKSYASWIYTRPHPVRLIDIEDITWARGDTDFIFEC